MHFTLETKEVAVYTHVYTAAAVFSEKKTRQTKNNWISLKHLVPGGSSLLNPPLQIA